MVKTTFMERFQSTIKFYQDSYHLHKSTFKGLGQFYREYADIQYYYSNKLITLTQNLSSFIPSLNKELSHIHSYTRQIINSVQIVSQMHFNYSQRLKEIGSMMHSEYLRSKKLKQKCIRIIKDKSIEDFEEIQKKKNRDGLLQKEKYICKVLYDNLEQLNSQESLRTQKIKEQIIVYFTVSKKILKREEELVSNYNNKVIQTELQIKLPNLKKIEEILIDQHNSYPSAQKLAHRNLELEQSLSFGRQSLFLKDKVQQLESHNSKINQTLIKYQQMSKQIIFMVTEIKLVGLFDPEVIYQYFKYSGQINSDIINQLSFQMLNDYNHSLQQSKSSENQQLLDIIRTNLKVKIGIPNSSKNFSQFMHKIQNKSFDMETKWNLGLILIINNIYLGHSTINTLENYIKSKCNFIKPQQAFQKFDLRVSKVIMSSLFDSLIVIRQGEPILYDGYIDMFLLLLKFGEDFLSIEPSISLIIFLHKFTVAMFIMQPTQFEQIQDIYKNNNIYKHQLKSGQQFRIRLMNQVCNCISEAIMIFYKSKIPLSNYIKVLICLSKINNANFSPIEHVLKCVRIAGFNYLEECDEDKKLTEETVWQGQQRLKNIVLILEEIDIKAITENHLESAANQLSHLLGVGRDMILNKLTTQFFRFLNEILNSNLSLLNNQQGLDKEGYALRLGMFLANLDKTQTKPLKDYDEYFKVLDKYLSATENSYNQVLEHSHKTQLWIAEENSQATQNCVDFCSLLYKPFEFLLSSLKKLQNTTKTAFVCKFSDFIKLRLNTLLKSEIVKYVEFLYRSLSCYNYQQPELSLKPKRVGAVKLVSADDLNRQKHSYRQLTRRIYNLIFLKDQLDEIVSDFLETDIYERMGNSIFNMNKLDVLASQDSNIRPILKNIKQIVEVLIQTQQKIVKRVANITTYHFFRRIMDNVYWQQQMNMFEKFISSQSDFKLSQYTFVSQQKEFEQIMSWICKNISEDILEEFNEHFTSQFFKFCRYEVLNSTKFRLPINIQKIVNFLDKDLSFLATNMKQRFFSDQLIENNFDKPIKQLLMDLRRQTKQIIKTFDEFALQNNKNGCLYLLVILNLRKNDEKAGQFVKKYKNLAI